MGESKRIAHGFMPVYNEHSRILILGSLPSVKSRENGFYYGHPNNRFWKVLAGIFHEEIPRTVEDKKKFLLSRRIAIWDVIESCDIIGSSDSSIKNVVPIDLTKVLRAAPIEKIFANGKTAARLYEKYSREKTGVEITALPSTSPANAAYSLERLIEIWKENLDK